MVGDEIGNIGEFPKFNHFNLRPGGGGGQNDHTS